MVGVVAKVLVGLDVYDMVGIMPFSGNRRSGKRRSGKRRRSHLRMPLTSMILLTAKTVATTSEGDRLEMKASCSTL